MLLLQESPITATARRGGGGSVWENAPPARKAKENKLLYAREKPAPYTLPFATGDAKIWLPSMSEIVFVGSTVLHFVVEA